MDFRLTEEQAGVHRLVRDLVEKEVKPLAAHTDETGEFPWGPLRKMGTLGLLGLNIPEQYGGAGADHVSAAILIEEPAGQHAHQGPQQRAAGHIPIHDVMDFRAVRRNRRAGRQAAVVKFLRLGVFDARGGNAIADLGFRRAAKEQTISFRVARGEVTVHAPAHAFLFGKRRERLLLFVPRS